MVFDLYHLEHDQSLNAPDWFHPTATLLQDLVDTAAKLYFDQETKVELFGSSVANLSTFCSDVDLNLTIPVSSSMEGVDQLGEVAKAIKNIAGMKNVHVRQGRVPIVHATFRVRVQFL